ncbi:KH type 1 domain protein, partial [mine drainage metagenome]
MRQFITPGEELPKEAKRNEYVAVYNGKAYSNIMGFYDTERKDIVPLEGMWKPRIGDSVIGVVERPTRA